MRDEGGCGTRKGEKCRKVLILSEDRSTVFRVMRNIFGIYMPGSSFALASLRNTSLENEINRLLLCKVKEKV